MDVVERGTLNFSIGLARTLNIQSLLFAEKKESELRIRVAVIYVQKQLVLTPSDLRACEN